ncbi:Xaa-Pro peptidase family protein [Parasalinivibrio latis]|uniref:M24 family metallopeptidase n=1 Tax=Parasalinivibrio latis TaxID=2952610 RepID=UPI0030E4C59D
MPILKAPSRGFHQEEYESRTEAFQRWMRIKKIDVAFFTTEPEFRYFSGFTSQFWESPTRPWFLVVPLTGKPIAVVPAIGAAGFENCWIDDVRSWPSPRPEDDGITLLAKTLKEQARRFHCIGAMLGPETHLRMPAANFSYLKTLLGMIDIKDVSESVREVRSIKSKAEIAKIRFACEVTAYGFEYLKQNLKIGMTEREACKLMHVEMLSKGADKCPYLISASGHGGYDNIIMGPTDRPLGEGDVLIIDSGANFDGYFSDFDRNFGFGTQSEKLVSAYDAVYQATEAALSVAGPGVTTGELWQVMWSVLRRAGALGNDVGRMGHGLGMQLTEWPSHVAGGDVELREGMVLTLEPGMNFAPNKMMVHEDNIVITASGCELLHTRTWEKMPIIT